MMRMGVKGGGFAKSVLKYLAHLPFVYMCISFVDLEYLWCVTVGKCR